VLPQFSISHVSVASEWNHAFWHVPHQTGWTSGQNGTSSAPYPTLVEALQALQLTLLVETAQNTPIMAGLMSQSFAVGASLTEALTLMQNGWADQAIAKLGHMASTTTNYNINYCWHCSPPDAAVICQSQGILFAPTDEAFSGFNDSIAGGLASIAPQDLANLLLYHGSSMD
jgi:hypothetical protein